MNVTIIVPVYAWREQDVDWLYECLISCRGYNVVVWDDGSPVSIDSAVRSFSQVRFLGGNHIGKSYARNRAAEAVVDGLIYPLDADDYLVGDLGALVARWDGTPLYGDLIKLHSNGIKESYPLLPFSCDPMPSTSVNVLHSKQQWEELGGWNESLNLFEDWEYNARLLWTYCAERVGGAMVCYRQHDGQSTSRASAKFKSDTWVTVTSMVQEYNRRNSMARSGCCGKRRRGQTPNPRHSQSAALTASGAPSIKISMDTEVNLDTLGDPGVGNVWAKYVGGRGMGQHYRRGMNSRKKYKVQYGGSYAIKANDAVTKEQFERGVASCGFVLMSQKPSEPTAPPPVVQDIVPVRQPVVREAVVEQADITQDELDAMSIRELRGYAQLLVAESGRGALETLLNMEKQGKARVGAVKIIEKALRASV